MFTDEKTKWRIGWYNEIKVPFLTLAVLVDNGTDCLPDRIKTLDRLVNEEVSKKSHQSELRTYTVEEEYMKYATSSKQVHQRAKIIIFQMIDQLQNPHSKGYFDLEIDADSSVSKIYESMTRILRKENPRLYRKLISDQVEAAKAREEEDKLMQEALNDNQSLEAKIERSVQKFVEMATEKLKKHQNKQNDLNMEHVDRMLAQTEKAFEKRANVTQEYI